MDCNECRITSDKAVPYIVYESAMAQLERHIKRLWIALLLCIALIFASNAIWVWYINQYDFESYEYIQDGQGVNILGDGNGVEYHGSENESAQAH